MPNRLLELEQSLGVTTHPAPVRTQRRKARRAARRLAGAAGRVAHAAGAVDYRVPGIVPAIKQPTNMICWATVATMMISWRRQMSMTIETAIGTIGDKWLTRCTNNKGLLTADKVPFLTAAGLAYEYPQSYTAEGWESLLRRYGPLWVTTDEKPGAGFAIHARIMTGIHGDGTVAGTSIDIVDPGTGTAYSENYGKFLEKYEAEARDSKAPLRIQVVHWPHDAGFSVARALTERSRAYTSAFTTAGAADLDPNEFEPHHGDGRKVRAASAFSAAMAGVKKMTAADATWAADADSPDYRHLATAGITTPFNLTGAVLDRLVKLNRFEIGTDATKVVFGLRGCAVDASVRAFTTSIAMRETVPNHIDNRCVIGVWDRSTSKVTAFQSSTVPNWKYMEAYRQDHAKKANMLPTGRYEMTVGTHRAKKEDGTDNPGRVQGALINPHRILVVRSEDDLTYTVRDTWDETTPYDNIHPGIIAVNPDPSTDPDYSSAGCNTIPGASTSDTPSGEWADFRAALGLDNKKPTAHDGKKFPYVLLTAREARMCASRVNETGMTRLRFGSKGDEVKSLQEALAKHAKKYYTKKADGDFGPGTASAWIKYQKDRDSSAADGIVTPTDATTLGFTLAVPATTAPAGGAPRAQSVEAFAADVPLSPANGGRSIDTSALEVGDIILSTTKDPASLGIRVVTSAPVSHSMLYIGGGQVVEAVASGVKLHQLADAISDATVAVAFRHPSVTPEQALRARDFAGRQLDKKYNYFGVVRQLPFRIDEARYCSMLRDPARTWCRNFIGRVYLGTGTNDTFFCSQLILAAFADAGVPLTTTPPVWNSPGEIAELSWKGTLNYVGHLKA